MMMQIVIGIVACIIFFFVGYGVGLIHASNAFLNVADECNSDGMDVFEPPPIRECNPCPEDFEWDKIDYRSDEGGDTNFDNKHIPTPPKPPKKELLLIVVVK